ncbi:MAG: TatD family hydrolase [Acidobacteriota bacterium]
MNGITDTHAHICDPVFDSDRDIVLKRAQQVGIGSIITVGENLHDAEKNLALAERHPGLRPAAGLFPTNLDLEQAREVRNFIQRHPNKIIAIGEVGLDYWKVQQESDREVQREILREFIVLSRKMGLPLNIHSRSAGRHAIAFLLQHSAEKVQLHAFDGKPSYAAAAVEAGYFFSIPPSIVRSGQKQKLVKRLPLANLLIETDSPVLGPAPGERNEPANAIIVSRAIAELKNIREEEVVEAITENTFRLYGWEDNHHDRGINT